MQKPVEKTAALILVLLIAGCTSHSTRPTQAPPPDARDQGQEEQRKQDRQQHEMERGELGATKTVLTVQWARGLDTCRPPLIPVKEKEEAWGTWSL
jgi:hypothetical protein